MTPVQIALTIIGVIMIVALLVVMLLIIGSLLFRDESISDLDFFEEFYKEEIKNNKK